MIFIATNIIALTLSALVANPQKPSGDPVDNRYLISIMTYNVENLFDTQQNLEKEDHTYLPLKIKKSTHHKNRCIRLGHYYWRTQCLYLNWSPEAFNDKLTKIAKVISSYNHPFGPDIVILTEIENRATLSKLNDSFKNGYPYSTILYGSDPRGINIGMLSRFPYADAPRLVPNNPTEKKSSFREFLRVNVAVSKDKNLIVYGVHFPSASKPTRDRILSLAQLTKFAQTEAVKHPVVAAGDFNINSTENNRVYRGAASRHWKISHLSQCHECFGTYYYAKDKSWSFLDAIMIYRGKNASFQKDSVKVWKPHPFQYSGKEDKPKRLTRRGQTVEGVSDHFPVVAKVLL